MLDQRYRGNRPSDQFGHHNQVAERRAAPASLDRHSHGRGLHHPERSPQPRGMAERLGAAYDLERALLRQEGGEHLGDGLLVG